MWNKKCWMHEIYCNFIIRVAILYMASIQLHHQSCYIIHGQYTTLSSELLYYTWPVYNFIIRVAILYMASIQLYHQSCYIIHGQYTTLSSELLYYTWPVYEMYMHINDKSNLKANQALFVYPWPLFWYKLHMQFKAKHPF